ncbi:hypothetical protein ESCOCP273M_06000 [Escherichia coli]
MYKLRKTVLDNKEYLNYLTFSANYLVQKTGVT